MTMRRLVQNVNYFFKKDRNASLARRAWLIFSVTTKRPRTTKPSKRISASGVSGPPGSSRQKRARSPAVVDEVELAAPRPEDEEARPRREPLPAVRDEGPGERDAAPDDAQRLPAWSSRGEPHDVLLSATFAALWSNMRRSPRSAVRKRRRLSSLGWSSRTCAAFHFAWRARSKLSVRRSISLIGPCSMWSRKATRSGSHGAGSAGGRIPAATRHARRHRAHRSLCAASCGTTAKAQRHLKQTYMGRNHTRLIFPRNRLRCGSPTAMRRGGGHAT